MDSRAVHGVVVVEGIDRLRQQHHKWKAVGRTTAEAGSPGISSKSRLIYDLSLGDIRRLFGMFIRFFVRLSFHPRAIVSGCSLQSLSAFLSR
jgi:hypothetical protein